MSLKSCKSILRNKAIMILTRPYMDYVRSTNLIMGKKTVASKIWVEISTKLQFISNFMKIVGHSVIGL